MLDKHIQIALDDEETFESHLFDFHVSLDKHRQYKKRSQDAHMQGKDTNTVTHNYVMACVDKDQKDDLAKLLTDEEKGVDLADFIVQRLLSEIQSKFKVTVKKPNPSATTSTLTD
jgi:hypothetical protein